MKKLILTTIGLLLLPSLSLAAEPEKKLYAKCNIRAFSQKVTWINYLSVDETIRAGKLVTLKTASGNEDNPFPFKELTSETGKKYRLEGQESWYLSTEPVKESPLDAAVGMTKEEVYAALCAPVMVLSPAKSPMQKWSDVQRTENMKLEDILGRQIWAYQYKKLGKKFVVEFGDDGKVSRLYWAMI